jgi:hypothetical protein
MEGKKSIFHLHDHFLCFSSSPPLAFFLLFFSILLLFPNLKTVVFSHLLTSDYAADEVAEPQLIFPGGVNGWNSGKIKVMYEALRVKFSDANPDLRDQLLATGNSWLVEHTSNDSQWGDGATGKVSTITEEERSERRGQCETCPCQTSHFHSFPFQQ